MRSRSAEERAVVFCRLARESGRPEIWTSLRDEADLLREAQEIDRAVAQGARLPLAGRLVAVKDNIDVGGLVTTAGSRSYAYLPEKDSTAVARLRAQGALVVGKTNLDQFATGLVGTRSPFGAVRNAWDRGRISGGSSSGSSVAVALGLVDFALGTDTAGSGRVPAALNGIWGVKPTRGRIPASGVVPACRSLDCVTVFSVDPILANQAVRTMFGPDGVDPLASRGIPVAPAARYRVVVPPPAELGDLAAGWAEAFQDTIAAFASAGVEVVERSIRPLLDAAALLYGGAFVAERYAAVGEHIRAHQDQIGDDLDPTVAAIVLGGSTPTAAELFADLDRLELLKLAALPIIADADAVLTPTTTRHPTLAEVDADPVGVNSQLGRFTNYANLLDMAALAFPAGTVHGLPFGAMLTGPAGSDDLLMVLAQLVPQTALDVFVVGAHLSGQPLNHELRQAGGTLVGQASTASCYRLYVLDARPSKPGLLRVAADAGESIRGEVWRVPEARFGTFVGGLPQPMCMGKVELAGGQQVEGFVCESVATEGVQDITGYGSWLAWLASRGQ